MPLVRPILALLAIQAASCGVPEMAVSPEPVVVAEVTQAARAQPRPLPVGTFSQMIEASDVIAIVRVQELRGPRVDQWYGVCSDQADLVVLKPIHGIAEAGDVVFAEDMMSGGLFVWETTYLAFLQRREGESPWYCGKYPVWLLTDEPEPLQNTIRTIRARIAIQALPEHDASAASVKKRALRQWYCDLALQPNTRWIAVEELERRCGESVTDVDERLTLEQLTRLSVNLNESEAFNEFELRIYALLRDSGAPNPSHWLLRYIESWEDRPPAQHLLWLHEAIEQVGTESQVAELLQHYRPAVEVLAAGANGDPEHEAEIRELWGDFNLLVWAPPAPAEHSEFPPPATEQEFIAGFVQRLRAELESRTASALKR